MSQCLGILSWKSFYGAHWEIVAKIRTNLFAKKTETLWTIHEQISTVLSYSFSLKNVLGKESLHPHYAQMLMQKCSDLIECSVVFMHFAAIHVVPCSNQKGSSRGAWEWYKMKYPVSKRYKPHFQLICAISKLFPNFLQHRNNIWEIGTVFKTCVETQYVN